MSNIGVPSNWQQMRLCIVAALDKLTDDGPWYSSDVRSMIERIFAGDDYVDDGRWAMTGDLGKAFARAEQDLRDKGIIIGSATDGDGMRLARWDA